MEHNHHDVFLLPWKWLASVIVEVCKGADLGSQKPPPYNNCP